MELGHMRDKVVRPALDDAVAPYLYDDELLDRWYNNAVREASIRTRALQDDTSAQCSISLIAGTPRYQLAREFMVVRAAYVPGRTEPLILTTAQRLDKLEPGWVHRDDQLGTPRYAMFDVGQKTIRLYPVPAEAVVMKLRVWRQPFETELMEDSDDEPVLILPDPEELKHWILYEAYNQKDSELSDPDRAATHYGLFEERFGRRPSAHELTLWSQSRIVGTRADVDY